MALIFKADGEGIPDPPYEFDSINEGAGNTFTRQEIAVIQGRYGYRFLAGGSTIQGNGEKQLPSDYGELYARFHVYLPSDLRATGFPSQDSLFFTLMDLAPSWKIGMGLRWQNDVPTEWVYYFPATGTAYSDVNFSLGEPHCLEAYYKTGTGGAAVFTCRVDGTVIAVNNADTSDLIRHVAMGQASFGAIIDAGKFIYFDSLELNTEGWIGPKVGMSQSNPSTLVVSQMLLKRFR